MTKTPPLGRRMRDRISGFTGIATGYVSYLTGCNQALLAPPAKPDGEAVRAEWFDEQRLEFVDDSLITLDNGSNPGGDIPPPVR